MNGVTRGARLWTIRGGDAHPIIVVDRSPDGWWVSFEGMVDEETGHALIEQRPSRHLYPAKGVALGSLVKR